LVGVGAIMPEVIAAARDLAAHSVTAGVVCLTSPDLVYRSLQQRSRRASLNAGAIVDELFPTHASAPVVTVHDGHPHTLAFIGAVRGDRSINLGVTDFGQSSSLEDAYALHGIDTTSIADAALTLVGR
jgi:pyruvate dehydrogenase E1 component